LKSIRQVLLGLAETIFEEQTSLEKLVGTMMNHARTYLPCQRIALYVTLDGRIQKGNVLINNYDLNGKIFELSVQ